MTVKIDMRPEVEAQLVARAQSTGQTLEAFIQSLLENEAGVEPASAYPMSGSERAAAFRAWAKSFPPDLPVLSLEDVSREKMYQRD